ncbi:hypothetical protein GCM10009087_22640 [Sphingomonas oligophenolica]|uniref:Lipoprotein n=1 Tax=Sphingomonas oligophenolica TaxID=301154 RepID=A0ABU9Y1R5_9SPHN
MLRPLAAAVVLAATLSACDGSKGGTSISINSTDSDGNVVADLNGNSGALSIDTPGFSGKINLPKLHLGASDFDMNGVHLYPGSTISAMNIDAHDGGKPGKDDDSGTVRISFASPAAPATVRDWYMQKLSAAGFTLSASGSGLTGTTNEKKPFKLDLAPDGADKSKGTITVS